VLLIANLIRVSAHSSTLRLGARGQGRQNPIRRQSVTFLLTDIEDSTRLWESAPSDMAPAAHSDNQTQTSRQTPEVTMTFGRYATNLVYDRW